MAGPAVAGDALPEGNPRHSNNLSENERSERKGRWNVRCRPGAGSVVAMAFTKPAGSPGRLARRLVGVAAAALAIAVPGVGAAERFMSAEGGRFIDAQGRQVILHGLNVVRKNDTWGSYAWLNEDGYARMRSWGMNCVRLGFTWAALEPSPGRYNEECLRWLERNVAWARRQGISVILDFHQDLYAARFSDGAPDWATLTDGRPHVAGGEAWSEAYVTSPAVQRAMDNFFANRPGPDGVGLQVRFAAVWRKVAERFAREPAVIGYDLMNEPFAGGVVPQGTGAMMAAMAAEMNRAGRTPPIDLPGVAAMWSDKAGRAELLKALGDLDRYGRVLDASEPLYTGFDRTVLQPFYQRVAASIREVDREHLLLFENNGAGNMGVRSALEPLTGPAGRRDPHQAYAPHGYDIVTDTAAAATASEARLGLILDRHRATATRLGLAMVVGEWGAFYGDAGARPAAEFISRKFESLLCGDLYWALEKDLQDQAVFPAICRPYPQGIAGELREYGAEPRELKFHCQWRESKGGNGVSRFYLPQQYAARLDRMKLTPGRASFRVEPAGKGGDVFLTVPVTGGGGERSLSID